VSLLARAGLPVTPLVFSVSPLTKPLKLAVKGGSAAP
jgi:hypothetical protein